MTGRINRRIATMSRLLLPLFVMTLVRAAAGAEGDKSFGEAKFPGEKWKLKNVISISGDALKFAINDKGDNAVIPLNTGKWDQVGYGTITIHEYSREERKAEPEEIMKFYRGLLKDPKVKPIIQSYSLEQGEAVEVYVARAKKDEAPQFCLVAVDSSTVTVMEIVSVMVDEVLRSLGGTMESISDSIRKEMETHRLELESVRKEMEKNRQNLEKQKEKLEKDHKELEKQREKRND